MKTQIRKNWYISSKVINVRENYLTRIWAGIREWLKLRHSFLQSIKFFHLPKKKTHLEFNIIDKGVGLVSGLLVLLTSERRAQRSTHKSLHMNWEIAAPVTENPRPNLTNRVLIIFFSYLCFSLHFLRFGEISRLTAL